MLKVISFSIFSYTKNSYIPIPQIPDASITQIGFTLNFLSAIIALRKIATEI